MLIVYEVCFWVGFLLTVLLALFGLSGQVHGGWHFGGHGGHSLAHGTAGATHGDGGQSAGPSPFNLYTILAFITGFGGVGYVLTSTGALGGLLSLLCAIGIGLLLAWIVFTVLWKLFIRGEQVMKESDYDLVGMFGHLSSPIPPGGTGEMKYTLAGTIRAIGARSANGEALIRGTEVVILEVERGIATVIEYDRHVHADGSKTGL